MKLRWEDSPEYTKHTLQERPKASPSTKMKLRWEDSPVYTKHSLQELPQASLITQDEAQVRGFPCIHQALSSEASANFSPCPRWSPGERSPLNTSGTLFRSFPKPHSSPKMKLRWEDSPVYIRHTLQELHQPSLLTQDEAQVRGFPLNTSGALFRSFLKPHSSPKMKLRWEESLEYNRRTLQELPQASLLAQDEAQVRGFPRIHQAHSLGASSSLTLRPRWSSGERIPQNTSGTLFRSFLKPHSSPKMKLRWEDSPWIHQAHSLGASSSLTPRPRWSSGERSPLNTTGALFRSFPKPHSSPKMKLRWEDSPEYIRRTL